MDNPIGYILKTGVHLMDKKDFKKMFAIISATRGFTPLSNFWFMESKECVFTIQLDKSNFGKFYYLTMNIFIQNFFGKKYTIDKNLGRAWGDAIRRPPTEYNVFLDLDVELSFEERKRGLESLFDNFVIPFSKKAICLSGVYSLVNERQIILSSDKEHYQLENLIKKKEIA